MCALWTVCLGPHFELLSTVIVRNRKRSLQNRTGQQALNLNLEEFYGIFCVCIGNVLLNLFGCGACINITQGSTAAPDIVLIALAFGLAVYASVSVSICFIYYCKIYFDLPKLIKKLCIFFSSLK